MQGFLDLFLSSASRIIRNWHYHHWQKFKNHKMTHNITFLNYTKIPGQKYQHYKYTVFKRARHIIYLSTVTYLYDLYNICYEENDCSGNILCFKKQDLTWQATTLTKEYWTNVTLPRIYETTYMSFRAEGINFSTGPFSTWDCEFPKESISGH